VFWLPCLSCEAEYGPLKKTFHADQGPMKDVAPPVAERGIPGVHRRKAATTERGGPCPVLPWSTIFRVLRNERRLFEMSLEDMGVTRKNFRRPGEMGWSDSRDSAHMSNMGLDFKVGACVAQ